MNTHAQAEKDGNRTANTVIDNEVMKVTHYGDHAVIQNKRKKISKKFTDVSKARGYISKLQKTDRNFERPEEWYR